MVSIILPTYNRAKCIKRAILSIIEQTYSDFELIVIDDGSTDNTREIIEEFSDSRIKYFYQSNRGAGAARNNGIKRAVGEYIAFHDSDDIWYKDKLAKQLDVMGKYAVDIVFSGYIEVTETGSTIGPIGLIPGVQVDMKRHYGIAFATVLGKSEIFKKYMFDENLPRLQDFELMYRLYDNHSFYYLGEVLYEYDNYGNNITGNPSKLLSASSYILNKHIDILGNDILSGKISGALINEANTIRCCDFLLSIKLLKMAYKYYPRMKTLVKAFMIFLGVFNLCRNICGFFRHSEQK